MNAPTSAQPTQLDQSAAHDNLVADLASDDRLCPGCNKSAFTEQGGLVVAFGQSLFHVNCFKCAKCHNQVTADTNLLLLSDGSPICANCSYNCSLCHQPILDEAIMTGDDSFHAHCFTCKVCKNRIDDLVFAKTSQGIYCMNCHNDRMIRIRKHTQRKAERERAAGGSGSSKSRERDARQYHKDSATSTPTMEAFDRQRLPGSDRSMPNTPIAHSPHPLSRRDSATATPPAVTVAPPQDHGDRPPVPQHPPMHRTASASSVETSRSEMKRNALPAYAAFADKEQERAGYPTKPLHVPNKPSRDFLTSESSASSLAPSDEAKRNKRRSINPALSLSNFNMPVSPPQSSPSLSPLSASFSGRPTTSSRSPTPPIGGDRDAPNRGDHSGSSRTPSPSPSQFHTSPTSPYERTLPLPPDDAPDRTVVQERPPLQHIESSPAAPYPSFHQPPDTARSLPDVHRTDRQLLGDPQLPTNGLRQQRSFDERGARPVSPSGRARSGSYAGREHAASPSHRADVPRSAESGTDTEAEPDGANHRRRATKSLDRDQQAGPLNGREDTLQPDDSDDMDESRPVERTSIATYIAPALPPIRFSMNTADFSELFSGMSKGGSGSMSTADIQKKLAMLAERSDAKEADSKAEAFAKAAATQAETTDGRTTPTSGSSTMLPRTPSTAHDADVRPKLKNGISLPLGNGGSDPSLPLRARAISESTGRHPSGSLSDPSGPPRIAISLSENGQLRQEQSQAVMQRLEDVLRDARRREAQDVKLDKTFVEAIVAAWNSKSTEFNDLKAKFDSEKRTSRQYIDGLSVAQTEYDRELKARREAEAEVTRLRVLLSGQAARLTALSGDSRRQELRQKVTREMDERLSGLEQDLSKLKVQRDMTLAEVEELNTAKSPSYPDPPANLSRTLSMRLDNIKTQYQHDLVPLTQQRETLQREIAELKAVRDVFLEETTTLNARNEELAQLSAQYTRKLENPPETPQKQNVGRSASLRKKPPPTQQLTPPVISGPMNPIVLPPSLSNDSQENLARVIKVDPDMTPNKAKWFRSKTKDLPTPGADGKGTKAIQDHNFQQLSILRFTRCDHCGDKMWGSQLRCTICNVAVHVRCLNLVQASCNHNLPNGAREESHGPPPPSMFGRDLVEQVLADANRLGVDRHVPVIVEKCIDAVETLALDYEGIYRKTGGSNQSKTITQLFERGDYLSFDLRDSDRFNDICSVTSVLKSYFRALPNPLLTYELHEQFVAAAVEIKDVPTKNKALLDLVNNLPSPHYFTLRMLMLHLNRVYERSERNLMNARNLGVVFGPTLMRSSDPSAEFGDMAGKALTIEWLVENAPFVFKVST